MAETLKCFTVELEKKGRTRKRLVTLHRPWAKRKFILKRQLLEYYDGDIAKGTINLANCKIKLISVQEADGKPFPFQLEIESGEIVILSAETEFIRTITVQFISMSSILQEFKIPFLFNTATTGIDVMMITYGKLVGYDWVYEGDVKNGVPHGNGKTITLDGSIFEGQFHYNTVHGKCKLTAANGFNYDGDWVHDKMNGYGELQFPNGDVYTGEFKDSKCHGKGKRVYVVGSVYEGEWKDGIMSGHGMLKLSNQDILEGCFENNVLTQGTWRYHNGDVYIGCFVHFKDKNQYMKHGYGRFVTKDKGTCDEGEWINGHFQPGTMREGGIDAFMATTISHTLL